MFQIDNETVKALMSAERDWLRQSPDRPEWAIFDFQVLWLTERGLPARVQGPDGLVWGAED